MKRFYSILFFISCLWLIITTFSGFNWGFFFNIDFHPRWVLITLIPLIIAYFLWIQKVQREDFKNQRSPELASVGEKKEIINQGYVILFFLTFGFLTGLGFKMGFIPFFIHQMIVWPLIPILTWLLISMHRLLKS